MEKLVVKGQNGAPTEVDVVRYFNLNGSSYFVYSFGIQDDQGYISLFIDKIGDSSINEDEWTAVKASFGEIVKANRSGLSVPITDLDYRNLEYTIGNNREFKLMPNAYELLGANKKVFNDDTVESNSGSDFAFAADNDGISLDALTVPEISENVNNEDITYENSGIIPNISDNSNQPVDAAIESVNSMPNVGVEAEDTIDTVAPDVNTININDFEQLYNQQLEINNKLQEEISSYKEKMEVIKNLIG